MLAHCEAGDDPLFQRLAKASADMYPKFVQDLRSECGVDVELRTQGTIRFADDQHPATFDEHCRSLSAEEIRELEPQLEYAAEAWWLPEKCVDPREVLQALLKAAHNVGVHVTSGAEVTRLDVEQGRAAAAVTTKGRYVARNFVNCAGAWAGSISPFALPTRPVKGQMLALVSSRRDLIRHVIRGNGVYLIPRRDGRIVVGSTVEDAGFDKRVDPDTIQGLHRAAAILVPELGQALIHEDWAGLRPGTPDKLPILGGSSVEGYFVATGHYRDGILLAPVTARLMSQMILGQRLDFDLAAFSPSRF